MRRILAVPILLPVLLLMGARGDYESVVRKFEAIQNRRTPPGARVSLSERELNAYVAVELPQVAPAGVRSPQVTLLGNNTATGRALINFLQIAHARGKEPNWVMRQMLDGERNVAVTAMVESRDGSARVHLQRVEVSGVPVQGAALDFLIQNYLLPNYPDAKIDQWFELKNNVDRIEVVPQVAYVVMKRTRGR